MMAPRAIPSAGLNIIVFGFRDFNIDLQKQHSYIQSQGSVAQLVSAWY
jgi:hypothetical protein